MCINVLWPGEPMAMYHWETDQEDFLVLSGEALIDGTLEGRDDWGAYSVDEMHADTAPASTRKPTTRRSRTPGSQSSSRRDTATAGCPDID
jgi:hypothetical protein